MPGMFNFNPALEKLTQVAQRRTDPELEAQRMFEELPDPVKAYALKQAEMQFQARLAEQYGLRPGDTLGRVPGGGKKKAPAK